MKVKLADDIFFKQQLLSLYKLSDKSFIGEFKSAFKGLGLDFYQNRIFTENDPVRQINWNLYAKFRTLYIKEFIEDRNRFNLIALDISKSMFQNFLDKSKIEVGLQTAFALLYSSLKSNDNTCFLLFDNEIRFFYPFNRKFTYFFKILNSLKSTYIDLQPTENIENLMKNIFNLLKKRTQIFLISDFAFPVNEKIINFIAERHKLTSIIIIDEEEERLSRQLKYFSSNEKPDFFVQIPYFQIIEDFKKAILKANTEYISIKTFEDPYIILQNFFENKIKSQF
ncbi:MAG TPA: DUF58 domain-containing protein [Exilispira sp.]|nr:DUF58 domain-containing protein [Exilispira sp.]